MDKITLSLLKLYAERTSLSLRDLSVLMDCGIETFSHQIQWLFKNGYLEIFDSLHKGSEYAISTKLRITQDGLNYLSVQRNKILNHHLVEFRAWLTLAIALAAFIKSFFF